MSTWMPANIFTMSSTDIPWPSGLPWLSQWMLTGDPQYQSFRLTATAGLEGTASG